MRDQLASNNNLPLPTQPQLPRPLPLPALPSHSRNRVSPKIGESPAESLVLTFMTNISRSLPLSSMFNPPQSESDAPESEPKCFARHKV